MAFALVWMVERAFYELRVQDEPVDPADQGAGGAVLGKDFGC